MALCSVPTCSSVAPLRTPDFPMLRIQCLNRAGASNSIIGWVLIGFSSLGSVSSSSSDGNGLAVWSSRPVPSSEFVSVLTSSFRRFLRSSTSSTRCSNGSVM